jgi:hypothetical protein
MNSYDFSRGVSDKCCRVEVQSKCRLFFFNVHMKYAVVDWFEPVQNKVKRRSFVNMAVNFPSFRFCYWGVHVKEDAIFGTRMYQVR